MISGILGNYRIESFINKGGMGTVYKAYDIAMDRYVALKALPPELFENEIARERFRREAHAIARLEHDHILPVIAYGEERNLAYIVMRYMPGGSLSDKLKNGRLPLHEVSHLLGQVADALDYAHENGIVHRDIKPSNVLLDQRGNTFLCDFGIARRIDTNSDLTTEGVIGTLEYISPELFKDSTAISPASDQYALGMMLYKMVTGEIPFHGQTPPAFRQMLGDILPSPCVMRRDLPEAAGQIILKALAKEPEDRYPSCRMLAQAFEAVIRKFITLQESDTALYSKDVVPLISDEIPVVLSDKTTTNYGRLGVQPESHHVPILQRRRTRLFLAGIGVVGLVLLIAVGSTMFPLSQGAAAIPVFAQGEVGVVFANFDYIDKDVAKVEPNLESEFESAGIPFIREDQVMTDRQEAQRISDLHNATIVIWGEVARGGVRLFFEITPRQGSVTTNLDQLEVSVADLDSFDTYIFQGMDTLYIVNLVIGQIDYFEGNYDHALAALNQAVALIPEERELDLEADALFLYRANIYSRLNDQESAIADYTQALELNPELAVALNNRAVAYMYSSRYDLAFIDLDRATELDPDFPFPYYNRGWMYSFLGEFTKAYDEFTQGFAVANK